MACLLGVMGAAPADSACPTPQDITYEPAAVPGASATVDVPNAPICAGAELRV
jgi:hypothetical protein